MIVTTTAVETHTSKIKQESGVTVTQLLNFGFWLWQSGGYMPRLFDVPLSISYNNKREEMETSDSRWDVVILKSPVNKEK